MPDISATLNKSNDPLSLINDSSLLWSSGTMWDDLVVENHKFKASRAKILKNLRHKIIVQLPASVETERNSKKEFNGKTSGAGNICLFPADNSGRLCLHQREVLLLILSADIFSLKPELKENHNLFDGQIKHIGMALKAEAESGFKSGRLYGKSLGKALSIHLSNLYFTDKSPAPGQKGGMSPYGLRRVVKYISDNLHEDVNLLKLAEIAGLSHYRFAHNFKDTTGFSPHRFIIQKRLAQAKQLLRETDKTVTEIAYAVGYGSPSRFTLSFRRETGMTPTDFRKSFG